MESGFTVKKFRRSRAVRWSPVPRLAGVLAIVLVVYDAGASPTFPGEIERHLGLAMAPPCTICHQGNPGVGTAIMPFALAMKQRGLVGNDTGSLDTALDALDGEMTDTDGDGVPDIEELRRGWDPNVPNLPDGGIAVGAARPMSVNPWYGCAVVSARSPTSPATEAFISIALPAFVWFRRRAKSKSTVRG